MFKDVKEAKLNRFANDEETCVAVYEVVRDEFLKSRGQRDIQILAAERLAIELLDKAWKELRTYKDIKELESTSGVQIGL